VKARRESIEENQKEQLRREHFSKVYGSYINIFLYQIIVAIHH